MIGFTPRDVRAMSLAETTLAIDGFQEMKRAEAGVREPDPPPTWEEIEEAKRLCPDIAPSKGAELLPEFRGDWDGKL